MPERRTHLLLVDDDPVMLRVIAAALAPHPDLRFATSGEEAVRMAREAPPDLIVLDLEMPGMNGFEVCNALQADPLLASIPVIFVTSHSASAVEVAALDHGAVDFVTKPMLKEHLAARVRAHLRTRRLLEELTLGGRAHREGVLVRREQPLLLIVDDDVATLRIMRHSLASLGEVHFATDGDEALRVAERLKPDLILLDAHMPGLDGFEVCTRLKAQPAFHYVPMVFVTRFCDPANERRALDIGAVDFVAKPYERGVLHARVRNLLEVKRRTDAQIRDIDDHWRRVSDARIADIVAAATDAILSYDADGKVVLANAAASRLLGRQDASLIGLSIVSLLGSRLPEVESGGGANRRVVLPRGNGEHFPTEVSVSRSGSGADRLTTVVLRDVAGRELLDEERSARSQMEARIQTNTRMLSFVAHEMGNSLGGMLGFAELMQTDIQNPLPSAQEARLRHISTSGEHLRALMADMIDLARVERTWFSLAPRTLDARVCIEDAVAAVTALAARAGVAVTLQPHAEQLNVVADPERLHQCLLNLLTNGVKYNRNGGWVGVEVGPTADDFSIAIAVRDGGQGMEAAQRQHLFEPFNRLGRQGGAQPGAGLGLVITLELVHAMGGQLLVESTSGAGSCFTIVLPRTAADAAAAEDADAALAQVFGSVADTSLQGAKAQGTGVATP